jgi:hypothetical protein
MKRFDASKFRSAFLTEMPHHGSSVGASSTSAVAAGGFSFEGGKHAMFKSLT